MTTKELRKLYERIEILDISLKHPGDDWLTRPACNVDEGCREELDALWRGAYRERLEGMTDKVEDAAARKALETDLKRCEREIQGELDRAGIAVWENWPVPRYVADIGPLETGENS